MSKYVGKMKDVLVSFNNTALDIRKKMQNAQAQYKADIAAAEPPKAVFGFNFTPLQGR